MEETLYIVAAVALGDSWDEQRGPFDSLEWAKDYVEILKKDNPDCAVKIFKCEELK